MRKLGCWLVAMMVWAVCAQAAQVQLLTTAEKANLGATHVVIFSHEDFTQTATNTAQAFTDVFAVQAKMGVEFVGMVLVTPFSVGTTNHTDSVLVKVGDGDDDDRYLTSTELAEDGSEVYLKWAPPHAVAAATAYTTQVLTNLVYNDGATTGNVTIVNGVTGAATVTVTELGRRVYTAADYVDFTFTPDANQALASHTAGEVRFYFRLWDAR
jgi:hypothetical protein